MHSCRRRVAVLPGSLICLFLIGINSYSQSTLGRVATGDEPAEVRPAAYPTAWGGAAGTSAASVESATGTRDGADEKWEAPQAGISHQAPLSRLGIGGNVSPLGIGINATTVLSDYFDARLMGNYFNHATDRFEVESFKTIATLHLASMAASLDWYPMNSVWRISPGVMFYNANEFSVAAAVTGGTSFTLNGQTFYSATANAATGATPLTGTGTLGLHPRPIAFTLAGGFGKFVPRSQRHWSFPAELGVVFMGAPRANVSPSGWVCLDEKQTQCGNISNAANAAAQEFNSDLQAELTKWRRDLGMVTIYPMFSYGVVYSFTIRQGWGY